MINLKYLDSVLLVHSYNKKEVCNFNIVILATLLNNVGFGYRKSTLSTINNERLAQYPVISWATVCSDNSCGSYKYEAVTGECARTSVTVALNGSS